MLGGISPAIADFRRHGKYLGVNYRSEIKIRAKITAVEHFFSEARAPYLKLTYICQYWHLLVKIVYYILAHCKAAPAV